MSNAALRDRFRQTYRNLNLQPLLDAVAIARFGIEYGVESIEELENLIDIAEPPHNKVIFAGHRGCGKSTLLAELERKLNGEPEQRFFVVRFSIADVIELSDVNHVNILFSIAVQMMAVATEARVEFSREQRQQIENWFDEKTRTTEGKASSEAEVGFDFVFLKTKLKADASVREEVKKRLKNSVVDLVRQLDAIAALIELRTQQEVLVIIDDLDKLDLAIARDIYYENVNALFLPFFRIIYTIPIGAVRDVTLLNSLKTTADNQMHFMRVSKLFKRGESRTPEVEPNPEVLAALELALYRRIDEDLIEPEVVRRIALTSGGVLRELVRIANECCQQALLKLKRNKALTELKINGELFELAINELRNDVAAPLTQREYRILLEIYHRYTYSAQDELETQAFLELLHWLYILEYRNADDWFDVHPIIVDLLERRGLTNGT